MAASMESTSGSLGATSKHQFCEIEATVTTGFEYIAKDEVKEKFQVESAVEKGHIRFTVPSRRVVETLELTTVDNLYVILQHHYNYQFGYEKVETLGKLGNLISAVDWDLGLKIWHKFSDYPQKVSSLPLSSLNQESHLQNEESKITNFRTNSENETSTCKDNLETKNDSSLKPNNIGSHDVSVQQTKNNESREDSPCSNSEPKKKVRRTCHGYPDMPSFRVTCYRNGEHCFSSMEAAAQFGSQMQDYFGWNVSMKDFDIEVVLFVQEKHVYIGIALTKESLHKRHLSYFGPTPLKPTTACGMLRFCHIQPGETVCDPMCGGGTIPIQAASFWPQAQHVCGEIHDMGVDRCMLNIQAVNEKRQTSGRRTMNLDLMKWDATRLPLKDSSVDIFCTDLPFGKRVGSKMRNWHLYPRVLVEMARTCRLGSGRACLLTQDKKCMMKSLQIVSEYWRRGQTLWVNIGGLAAGVYLLHRTNNQYNVKSTQRMICNANHK